MGRRVSFSRESSPGGSFRELKGDLLDFTALPGGFLAALVGMILVYLVLIELGKKRFYGVRPPGPSIARPRADRERWIHHRASRRATHAGPHRRSPARTA